MINFLNINIIMYYNKYLQYKTKYLKLKKELSFKDDNLIKKNIIDHHYISYNIEFNNLNIKILNLNVAQRNIFRSYASFNDIGVYLRTQKNLDIVNSIDKDKLYKELSKIIYEKKKLNKDLKELINDNFYIKLYDKKNIYDIKIVDKLYNKIYKITKLKPLEIILKKNNRKWDDKLDMLNKLYPQGYYIDIIFDKEDQDDYYKRLKSSLKFLLKQVNKEKEFIITLQEINPLYENNVLNKKVDKILNKLNLQLIDLKTDYDKVKTNSILLIKKNSNLNISIMEKDIKKNENKNKLIKHFSEGKSLRQNIRYELKVGNKKLEIFNIHTKLIDNEEALKKFIEIIKYSKNKNIIIVGDMNLQINSNTMNDLNKLLRDNDMIIDFIATPSINYSNNFTYDVFIAKGIKLVT